ncbi:hypothetical protein GCM10027432_28320 [Lysobacter fragariae]
MDVALPVSRSNHNNNGFRLWRVTFSCLPKSPTGFPPVPKRRAPRSYAPGAYSAPGPQATRDFSTRRPCRVEKHAASMPRALRRSDPGRLPLCYRPGDKRKINCQLAV